MGTHRLVGNLKAQFDSWKWSSCECRARHGEKSDCWHGLKYPHLCNIISQCPDETWSWFWETRFCFVEKTGYCSMYSEPQIRTAADYLHRCGLRWHISKTNIVRASNDDETEFCLSVRKELKIVGGWDMRKHPYWPVSVCVQQVTGRLAPCLQHKGLHFIVRDKLQQSLFFFSDLIFTMNCVYIGFSIWSWALSQFWSYPRSNLEKPAYRLRP